MAAALLPLDPGDATILLFALVTFADQAELDGDPCSYAPVCDRIADRVRRLEQLEHQPAAGWVRALTDTRPQG